MLVGRAAAYLVQVTNAGPSDLVDLELRDLLPAGTQFIQAEPGAGEWSLEERTLIWLPGPLPAGGTGGVRIVVMAEAAGGITNVATVSGDFVTQIRGQPVRMGHGGVSGGSSIGGNGLHPEPVMINDLLHYTLTVTNHAWSAVRTRAWWMICRQGSTWRPGVRRRGR